MFTTYLLVLGRYSEQFINQGWHEFCHFEYSGCIGTIRRRASRQLLPSITRLFNPLTSNTVNQEEYTKFVSRVSLFEVCKELLGNDGVVLAKCEQIVLRESRDWPYLDIVDADCGNGGYLSLGRARWLQLLQRI